MNFNKHNEIKHKDAESERSLVPSDISTLKSGIKKHLESGCNAVLRDLDTLQCSTQQVRDIMESEALRKGSRALLKDRPLVQEVFTDTGGPTECIEFRGQCCRLHSRQCYAFAS